MRFGRKYTKTVYGVAIVEAENEEEANNKFEQGEIKEEFNNKSEYVWVPVNKELVDKPVNSESLSGKYNRTQNIEEENTEILFDSEILSLVIGAHLIHNVFDNQTDVLSVPIEDTKELEYSEEADGANETDDDDDDDDD